MDRKKVLIGAGITLIVVLLVAVNVYKNSKEKGLPVQAFKVKTENLEQIVLASGKVEVEQRQEYTAQLSATVTKVYVEVGDRVKSGDVLLQLDTAQLERQLKQEEANLAVQQANLTRAKTGARSQVIEQGKASLTRAETALNNARASYQRSQELFRQGAISQENLEATRLTYVSAEADYRTAKERLSLDMAGETKEALAAQEAQVQQAQMAVDLTREQISKATVRAGMDGIVLDVNTEEGKYVSTGSPLASVGDPGSLMVKAEVSEADSGKLKVGQPVKVTAGAVKGEEYQGKIKRVSPVAVTRLKDQSEQTNIEITVEITNFDDKLKPGYNTDLHITTVSLEGVPVIPYEAVVEQDKEKSVYVISDGRVDVKAVTTGVGNELYVHVTKGLKEGDQVVINPPEKLKDQDIVSVQEPLSEDKGNSND